MLEAGQPESDTVTAQGKGTGLRPDEPLRTKSPVLGLPASDHLVVRVTLEIPVPVAASLKEPFSLSQHLLVAGEGGNLLLGNTAETLDDW
jgi:hypothetical protein